VFSTTHHMDMDWPMDPHDSFGSTLSVVVIVTCLQ
jgi:hypothetical protein